MGQDFIDSTKFLTHSDGFLSHKVLLNDVNKYLDIIKLSTLRTEIMGRPTLDVCECNLASGVICRLVCIVTSDENF